MSITAITFNCPHCSAEHKTAGEPVYCDCGHGWQATLSGVHPPTEWYEAKAIIEAKEKADAEGRQEVVPVHEGGAAGGTEGNGSAADEGHAPAE